MKQLFFTILALFILNSAYAQVKATSAEINTGTDDDKFATALALQGSKYLDQNGAKVSAVTAAGANTYTANIAPAITNYSSGQVFYVKITTANTGASTLNLNGLGAKALVKDASTALAAGDLLAGKVYAVYYDGTNFQVMNVAGTVAQTLSLGANAGNIAISSGNSVNLRSLTYNIEADGNIIPTSPGFYPTFNTSGSVNYPTQTGGGFTSVRGGNLIGAFQFYQPASNAKLQFRRGISTTAFSPWETFASQEWTTANFAPIISGSYLPLTGGTLTGNLIGTTATFSETVAANEMTFGYINSTFKGIRSNTPVSFLNGGAAQSVYTGGLLTSNSYSDSNLIPAGGIFSRGNVIALGTITSPTFIGNLNGGINNIPTNSLVSRYSAGTGQSQMSSVGGGLNFSTTGAIHSGYETGATTLRLANISNPTGGTYKGAATVTGAIKITLPPALTGNMIVISGTLYEYNSSAANKTCKFTITMYQPSKVNGGGATFTGFNAPNHTVRLVDPSTIYIGELTSVWSYLGVSIDAVQASYNASGTLDNLSTGWAVGIETADFGTVVKTITNTLTFSSLVQPLAGYVLGANAPITATDTKLGAFGKLQAQLNAKGIGTITSVTSANSNISVATGTTTPVLTLNSGNGPNQVVLRNGAGNIVSTAFVGDLTGNAATASSVLWAGVTGKPTSLAGYGITDAATQGSVTAIDANAVHKTGNETITGVKLFSTSVGIGTTNVLSYKLAVGGGIIAESVKVKPQGSWPDYVFEKDYPMLPLNDLEKFVLKNKHLPDVPNADEVKKEGIDVGEMNAKLLQKIEELTLYIIDQQKEIKDLKTNELRLSKAVEKLDAEMNLLKNK